MPTLYCPHCGYNLTSAEDRGACPECGKPFDVEQLRRDGGIPRVKAFPQVVLLLMTPIAVTLLLLCCLLAQIEDGFIYAGLGVFGLVGSVTTSIIVGRRIGRRLALRPPKSMPNASSVSLTIVFAGLFFGGQIAVAAVVFFVGCTGAVMVMGMGH